MFPNAWKVIKENRFEVDNEISNDLICGICKGFMIKACNTPCGCIFCSECIEHYLNGNDKFCPGTTKNCRKKLINFVNDIKFDWSIDIRISETVVNCPRQNCEFKERLGMIENHIRTCYKQSILCPFNVIGCEINEVMNDEMKAHLNEDNYCNSKLLIDLINNLRNEMESLKKEIIELRNENIELKIDNRKFNKQFDNIWLRSTNQQEKMCEMERKESENREQIEDLIEEIVATKSENRSMKEEIKIAVESINETRQHIEMIQTKSKQKFDELIQNIEQQHEENKKLQVKMERCTSEIRIIQTKLGNDNLGLLEWKIENVTEQECETEIYSRPFYSEPFGYTMNLIVYIESEGEIGVSFHLMPGKFDDKLEWPFRHAVTLDVIDSENGNVCHSQTKRYSDCTNTAGWGKPSSNRNSRIHMTTLPITSPLIKNNQLLVKCRVTL